MDRIVEADRIIVGPVGEVLDRAAVLVRGDRISGVGPADELAVRCPGAERLRFPGASIMPGLVNSHVHLAADLSREPFGTVRQGPCDEVLALVRANAQACLRSGYTTVRDLGDAHGVVAEVRDQDRAVASSPAPRILAAGAPLTISGGHCWFLGGVADTDAEIRTAIDARAAASSDLIKVMAGGGQITTGGPSEFESQYTVAQLRLIVEHAASHGLTVAAHAHGTETIMDCIEAGVATIEHCGWRSGPMQRDRPEEAVRRMAAQGTIAGDTTPPQWRRMVERITFPDGFRFGDQISWMTDHGVAHVIGTDSGMPNAVFDEFRTSLELYEELGFDRARIIETATTGAARLLGLGASTGAVREGLDADLLVVDGNPLDNLDVLHRPSHVMVRGRGYSQADLSPAGTATEPVA